MQLLGSSVAVRMRHSVYAIDVIIKGNLCLRILINTPKGKPHFTSINVYPILWANSSLYIFAEYPINKIIISIFCNISIGKQSLHIIRLEITRERHDKSVDFLIFMSLGKTTIDIFNMLKNRRITKAHI